jgi:hypothetical protein
LNDFHRALLGYALERAPVHPPVPPPDDDLQLVCSSMPPDDQPALYRYDPATGALNHERELGSTAFLGALPDNQGVVVATIPTTQVDGDTFIWRDGQNIPISFSALNRSAALLPLPLNAPENQVPLMIFDSGNPLYALLSLDQCGLEIGCEAQILLGVPDWSPDGSWTVLAIGTQSPLSPVTGEQKEALLLLADGQGKHVQIMEIAVSPFWLDNDTVGYVRSYDEPVAHATTSLLMEDIGQTDKAPQNLLDTSDLHALTGLERELHIDRVIVSPVYPDYLLIITADALG